MNRLLLVVCACLLILSTLAVLLWQNIDWADNRSDLDAGEIISHINDFFDNNPDHPVTRNLNGWRIGANNIVNVTLIDDSREQIALFRREVINSRLITFSSIRGDNIYLPSEPLHVNSLLENVTMTITGTNKEENYVIRDIFNGSKYSIALVSGFQIEIFKNENWWVVPRYVVTLAGMGPCIKPDEPLSPLFNSIFFLISLDSGRYRLRQTVYRMTDMEAIPQESDRHDLVAEFYWE